MSAFPDKRGSLVMGLDAPIVDDYYPDPLEKATPLVDYAATTDSADSFFASGEAGEGRDAIIRSVYVDRSTNASTLVQIKRQSDDAIMWEQGGQNILPSNSELGPFGMRVASGFYVTIGTATHTGFITVVYDVAS